MASALAKKEPSPNSGKFQPGNKCFKLENLGRTRDWDDQEIVKEADALKEWIQDKKNYYFNSFLNLRGLHPEHVSRFCERSSVFSDAVRLAKALMEERLVEMAITKKGDGNFIKFVLSNKAGWKERNEISGDSANPLALVLEKIAKQNLEPIQCEVVPPAQIESADISKID